ncbi:hypothetical protein AZA_42693 [Nitrospirillum viridazoti Y2]|nr:hypothetical protein AZA_42693 [Nitrospirillum amazonense Y2]
MMFLRHAAMALRAPSALHGQGQIPPVEPVQAATHAYLDMVQTLRAEGVLRELPRGVTGQIYTLSFALEQLSQDLADLHARAEEMIPPARHQDKTPEEAAVLAGVEPVATQPPAAPSQDTPSPG